jgi:hypothetical protein
MSKIGSVSSPSSEIQFIQQNPSIRHNVLCHFFLICHKRSKRGIICCRYGFCKINYIQCQIQQDGIIHELNLKKLHWCGIWGSHGGGSFFWDIISVVCWKASDVSEEHVAFISALLATCFTLVSCLAYSSTLNVDWLKRLHGVISHKKQLFNQTGGPCRSNMRS